MKGFWPLLGWERLGLEGGKIWAVLGKISWRLSFPNSGYEVFYLPPIVEGWERSSPHEFGLSRV